MRAIAADAWRRIKEIEDQGREEGEEFRRDPTQERREKFYAHGKEIGRKRPEILDETITKLRQELGEEDFKKLDDYIYKDSPAGMAAAAAKRRANAPDPQQSGNGGWPRSRF